MHPELTASIERFKREMETVDDDAHVLLKGHLLLEEAMSEIIDQYVFHRENVEDARLSFAQKLHLSKALCLRKNTFGEWALISAINTLRNDLAHQLNSTEREKKLAKVRELYFREAAGYAGIEELKKEADVVILFNACAHCAGFLATFLRDSKGFRAMIHAMDRGMNPDQPAFPL